ncbi:MAG: hypothetical protein ABFC62_03805 [Clostridiaceae bacterium]
MPDYKKLYFKLMRAVDKAVRILAEAQADCEEACMEASDKALEILVFNQKEGAEEE